MKDSKIKRALVSLYEAGYKKYRQASEWWKFVELRTIYRLNIMSWKQTLRYIQKRQCSIARFGDGEFMLLMNTGSIGFQSGSKEISMRLDQVLQNRNPDLLICIPGVLNSVCGMKSSAAHYWIDWGMRDAQHWKVTKLLRSHVGRRYKFGDTQITRCYMDWKSVRRAEQSFALLKQIWANRDLLIVEGEKSCLGVGSDLFVDAKSISRIIAPAEGAFDKYEEILNTTMQYHSGQLVLLALGPTATILASDLSNRGVQALDIGHVDIEYEWYRMGAKQKVQIPGKYTNEAIDKQEQQKCTDLEYLKEILVRI